MAAIISRKWIEYDNGLLQSYVRDEPVQGGWLVDGQVAHMTNGSWSAEVFGPLAVPSESTFETLDEAKRHVVGEIEKGVPSEEGAPR